MRALLAQLDADHDGGLNNAEFGAFVVCLTEGLFFRAALQLALMVALGPLFVGWELAAGRWCAGGGAGWADELLHRGTGLALERGAARQFLIVLNVALLVPVVFNWLDKLLLSKRCQLRLHALLRPLPCCGALCGWCCGGSAKPAVALQDYRPVATRDDGGGAGGIGVGGVGGGVGGIGGGVGGGGGGGRGVGGGDDDGVEMPAGRGAVRARSPILAPADTEV